MVMKLLISIMIFLINNIMNDDDLNPLQNAKYLIPLIRIVKEYIIYDKFIIIKLCAKLI